MDRDLDHPDLRGRDQEDRDREDRDRDQEWDFLQDRLRAQDTDRDQGRAAPDKARKDPERVKSQDRAIVTAIASRTIGFTALFILSETSTKIVSTIPSRDDESASNRTSSRGARDR